MEFVQVFVIQCKSTGKFLTTMLNHTSNLNKAGHSFDKASAVDTGLLELDTDFTVYDFYLPRNRIKQITEEGLLVANYGSGLADPHL